MANLLNWPLIHERQTVDCYKHNSNVCVIFTVPINSSSKLARIKPSQLLMMSSGTSKLRPAAQKWRRDMAGSVTWSAIIAHNKCMSYPVPKVLSAEKQDVKDISPPHKWPFKFFFHTFAGVSYPLKIGGTIGATIYIFFWGGGGGTRHFFLLTLYNFKNIGGHMHPPPPTPRSLLTMQAETVFVMCSS